MTLRSIFVPASLFIKRFYGVELVYIWKLSKESYLLSIWVLKLGFWPLRQMKYYIFLTFLFCIGV